MEQKEKSLRNTFQLLILVGSVCINLIFIYMNITGEHSELIKSISSDIIAYSIVFTTATVFFMFFRYDNKDDSLKLTLQEIKNELEKIERSRISYKKSGHDAYSNVFAHYLDSENNCLDYIALASTESIIGEAINPDIKERMKQHNDRSATSTEKLIEYKDLIINNNDEIKRITNSLSKISQGALHKIICDVKVGGIIYEIFNEASDKDGTIYYLFAATVDQRSIDEGQAYKEVESIFDEIKDKVQEEFKVRIINHKT